MYDHARITYVNGVSASKHYFMMVSTPPSGPLTSLLELTIPTRVTSLPKVTVRNLFSWSTQRWEHPVTFGYRFGVAYEISDVIHDLLFDGLLGLGTSECVSQL